MRAAAALAFGMAALGLPGCAHEAPAPPAPPPEARLVRAVRADSIGDLRELLADGVSPDAEAPDGTRPLGEAARNGRIEAGRVLLEAGANPDLADSAGLRPFDLAMERGNPEFLAMLVLDAARAAGASPEALAWFQAVDRGDGGAGDWHRVLNGELASLGVLLAAVRSRTAVASSLRRAASLPNRTHYAALSVAARFGEPVVVEALLRAGANPDVTSGSFAATPLMEAARDGYVAIGRRLIRAGARLNFRDAQGNTALHWAVRLGQTEFARMLLSLRADPAARNAAGQSPLELAQANRHQDLIDLLRGWRR
jgi:ankyrin repeat protein